MATEKPRKEPKTAPKAAKKAAGQGKTGSAPVRRPVKASASKPKNTRKPRIVEDQAGSREEPVRTPKRGRRSASKPATLIDALAQLRKAAAARPGPLERAVRADLRSAASASPVRGSLRQVAYSLARQLDAGAGMAAAAIAKELRATLDQLTRDDDDHDDELERFIAGLSAQVGDSASS